MKTTPRGRFGWWSVGREAKAEVVAAVVEKGKRNMVVVVVKEEEEYDGGGRRDDEVGKGEGQGFPPS